ncbi:MAG: EI24 domain-containing protein [Flavobacteriales bacterium]|nr:EI24 domain-containing protein [Flavobacteriales bacterium]
MSFSRDFGQGSSGFFRAFGFVFGNGMWWMFLVPILLWLLLAFGMYHLLEMATDQVGGWASGYLQIPVEADEAGWWSDVKSWLNGARETVVSWILRLAVGYVLFIANKYIVLVLLSPLLAYASERAEEIVTGRVFPFSFPQLMKDALRGALIAIRNGVLEVAISIGIWVLTLFVPILVPFSFIILFLVSAYFYGFSMFDYVFERRRMRISESVHAVNSQRGAVIANGIFFSLLMKIPLIGLMLAPVMASVGAVLATVKKEGTAVTTY